MTGIVDEYVSPTGAWYNHTAQEHHVACPPLADWIAEYLKDEPKPVYDLGCGNGSYLARLAERGVTNLLGYEAYPPKPRRFPLVVQQDLTHPFSVPDPGHVICIEVGEHVPVAHEATFLDNIRGACDGKLILSWALPGQNGLGHVNCLSNEDVIDRLAQHGFTFLPDATRSVREVSFGDAWYLQNTIMIFARTAPHPAKTPKKRSRIHDLVDRVVCINLDHRMDKWSTTQEIFERANISVERFSATNGASLDPAVDHAVSDYHKSLRGLSAGEVGCLFSHARVLREMVARGDENLLVLEDDVDLSKDLDAAIGAAESLIRAKGFDLLYLGGNHLRPLESTEDARISRTRGTLTTSSYVVSRSYAERILPILEFETVVRQKQIDVVYYNTHPFARAFTFSPAIAWQRPTVSDIQGHSVDYSRAFGR